MVVGVGVRPRLALAEQAGLAMDRGVAVNAYLRSSVPGSLPQAISRAGPIRIGTNIRVEHWVVAERQGQTAARNMLGAQEFDAVPFFWSQHYDVPINYVGHAEQWDQIAIDGPSRPKTACCATSARAACLPSPRYPRSRKPESRAGHGAGAAP